MLGKMLIHGLVAAAAIGSAAMVYAQVKDAGMPDLEPRQKVTAFDTARDGGDDGYLRPGDVRSRDRDFRSSSERRRDRHDDRRDHDDDDDDD